MKSNLHQTIKYLVPNFLAKIKSIWFTADCCLHRKKLKMCTLIGDNSISQNVPYVALELVVIML